MAQPNRFIGDLIIRVIPHWEIEIDGSPQLYETQAPFGFISSYGTITVPKGFITDFGSVPSLSKALIDDDDPDLLYGSLPHDWLYKCKGNIPPIHLTRYEADCVLREAMQCAGAPWLKTWTVFRAVRIGGGRW